MKNIFKLFLPAIFVLSAMSCNDRLEGDEVQSVDALKIDSVKIANYSMDVYSVQSIKTYSSYTADCEGFYGYDYLHTDQFERKVVSYKFKTDANCGDLISKASWINFQPQKVGTYHFKFYGGKDASGESIWLEESIEVN